MISSPTSEAKIDCDRQTRDDRGPPEISPRSKHIRLALVAVRHVEQQKLGLDEVLAFPLLLLFWAAVLFDKVRTFRKPGHARIQQWTRKRIRDPIICRSANEYVREGIAGFSIMQPGKQGSHMQICVVAVHDLFVKAAKLLNGGSPPQRR